MECGSGNGRPRSDVIETTLHSSHPVGVLNRALGDGFAVPEYTFTEGTEPGSTNVKLIVPCAADRLSSQPWYRPPETALSTVRGAESVRSIRGTSRHHLRMLLNSHHPEARLLMDIVTRLGGHVSSSGDGITLLLTAEVSVIDQLYDFIGATPGLSSGLRINPVFESMSARDAVDDLVPRDTRVSPVGGEECTLRVMGDDHGSPDVEIVRHLEAESRNVQIVSLSRRPVLPGSAEFEMIIVLRAQDARVFQSLPGALVSDHAGVYSAKPVASEDALQYVQIVAPDVNGAKNLVQSQRGLQTRHRRMDGRPVVTGSVPLHHVAELRRALEDVPFPRAINVPLVPTSFHKPSSPQWYWEMGEEYRQGMRQLLVELLPEEDRQCMSEVSG